MAVQEGTIDDDADSALGSDAASSTASVTSSIREYRTIHGRTYHSKFGDTDYWASNDERQTEAMDINHHALTLSIGDKLHLAPLKKDIKRALDVGTGTVLLIEIGSDFADEFPDTEVVGTDLSPIQPSWVPPNLKFEIDDCTKNWTFPRDSFDYIHIRWLVGSIPDWNELFKQAYKCCKPGGYLESYEGSATMESDDGTVLKTSAMGQWASFFVEGGKKLGQTFLVVDEGIQRKAMEAAGFVDIQERNIKTPVGGWPDDPKMREIGQYAQLVLEEDSEGYVLFLANAQGWSKEEVIHHGYYRQKVVWGRKPDSS
ncbi:S-adenosyl-L-methionine-dependent methyltransferase [Phialemonium atrogriseum]|uniref:S-adenosyl-L-methionine-dependent methyltransferase n=1 Tax=Phialemonium atrogriseum TaxID=1093897 RepID=A0AAJ0C0S4_9PEZI|nr:S-adenosyl-L-methionine-dependent methyltransferase [Phialemonium atrogriseum]KAK1767402.1 S-adenosyl-L-methionine-dependent methyltransferase [Phialemonium atrogriseum]